MEAKLGDGPLVMYYPNQPEGGTKLYGLTDAHKNYLGLFLSHEQQFFIFRQKLLKRRSPTF
jgi:hypothetical protein